MAAVNQYATEAELAAFLGAQPVPDEPDRLLLRASELIASRSRWVSEEFWHVIDVDHPADVYTDALRDAACAQVEFWIEFGESHDVVGLKGSASVSKLQISNLPDRLAPRAHDFLRRAGLVTGMVAIV